MERRFYADIREFDELYASQPALSLRSDHPLSVRPLLEVVDRLGRYTILDKLNVRTIHVFDADGSFVGPLGSEGRAAGQYIYPHTVGYAEASDTYYVYDGDLLQLLAFDGALTFRRAVTLPLLIDQIAVTSHGRIFTYSSTRAAAGPPGRLVHEIDESGRILRGFGKQSSMYSGWAASEGGGIAVIKERLYFITPYEYQISVFTLDGSPLVSRRFAPRHYRPPGPAPTVRDGQDRLKIAQAYHTSWSHIRQILNIDDRMVGIVSAEPGEQRVFLDLYDLDLSPLAHSLVLPEYAGRLVTKARGLFAIAPTRLTDAGTPEDATLRRYQLRDAPSGLGPGEKNQ